MSIIIVNKNLPKLKEKFEFTSPNCDGETWDVLKDLKQERRCERYIQTFEDIKKDISEMIVCAELPEMKKFANYYLDACKELAEIAAKIIELESKKSVIK